MPTYNGRTAGLFLCGCFGIALLLFLVVHFVAAEKVRKTIETNAISNGANKNETAAAPDIPLNVIRTGNLKLLAGRSYPASRQILIDAGWLPLNFTPADKNEFPRCNPFQRECLGMPEIDNCAGTGDAPCNGWWQRGQAFLQVTMSDGPHGLIKGFRRAKASDVPMVEMDSGARLFAYPHKLPRVTARWLTGTWGPEANEGSRSASCETDNLVTFANDGTFHESEAGGQFSTDGKRIIYSQRVEFDYEGNEDRSHFNEVKTSSVAAVDDNIMIEAGDRYYRCDGGSE